VCLSSRLAGEGITPHALSKYGTSIDLKNCHETSRDHLLATVLIATKQTSCPRGSRDAGLRPVLHYPLQGGRAPAILELVPKLLMAQIIDPETGSGGSIFQHIHPFEARWHSTNNHSVPIFTVKMLRNYLV